MANRTADYNYVDRLRNQHALPLTDALTIYKGSLMALSPSTGYAVKWADTAGLRWMGPATTGEVGDTSATGQRGLGTEAEIDVRGVILQRVPVTGASAITDVGKPVYCGTDNAESDLTLTPTVNVGAIGRILNWYSSTTCDVVLRTPEEYMASAGAPVLWSVHLNLATIADGDVVTAFTPGFSGRIESIDFITGTPVTTAAKATTLNAEIGTTNLTGGTVALTSAACTPLGAIVAGAAITAANHFGSTDTISIEASSTTAFVEGDGMLVVTMYRD